MTDGSSASGGSPAAGAIRTLPAWALATVLALLFVVLFHPILAVRWRFYTEQPRYSHALLLPFVSGLWIWERWDLLREVPRRASTAGLAFLGVSVLFYVYGRWVSVNVVQHLAMVGTIAGLVWGLGGRGLLRALAFPVGYLALTQPLPKVWDDRITLPLQGFATTISERVFDALGWVVIREGNVLQLPGLKLLVEDACSGVHSLYALVALGVAWVFMVERPRWLMVTLILATVPVSVAANSIRVVATGVLAFKVDPSYARGVSHEVAGLIVFSIGICLLLFLDWCLKPDPAPAPAPASEGASAADRDPL